MQSFKREIILCLLMVGSASGYAEQKAPTIVTNATAQASRIEEPSGTLTLRLALALALAKNPNLAAFSWEVRASEARVLQAGLLPNPEFGFTAEHFGGSDAFRDYDAAETTLQLSQLIELAGKRSKRRRAASLERDLAGWDYETKRIEVFSRTATDFVEVLAAQQQLALAEESVRLAEEVVNAIADRVKAARSHAVEATRQQVALASAQIERDQLQRALLAARHRLAANWGSTTPRFERVEGNLERVPTIPPLEELSQRLRKNPDLARWATELEQRRTALESEKSKRVPDVTLGGGVRYYSDGDDGAFLATVSIPLPLFDRKQGAIAAARAQVSKAENEKRAVEVRVATALAQDYQALSAAQVEIAAVNEKVLPGAQEAFETMRQGYQEGRFSYLEVLDAQRTLFAARTQRLRALSNYHRSVIAIERLIGEPLNATQP